MPSDAEWSRRLQICDTCPHYEGNRQCGKAGVKLRSLPHGECPLGHWGKKPMRGLGDWVARLLARFGVRKWKGCRCDEWQQNLNRWFPFK